MLNDLGVSLMAASAYRHCLATETPDITTSEGQGQLVISLCVVGRHLAAAGGGNESRFTDREWLQVDCHKGEELLSLLLF